MTPSPCCRIPAALLLRWGCMSEPRMIAALYVETGGCYFGLDGVDPWDEARDARTYTGPHRLWRTRRASGGAGSGTAARASHHQYKLGDDGGCFRLRCKPSGTAMAVCLNIPRIARHGMRLESCQADSGRRMAARPRPGRLGLLR